MALASPQFFSVTATFWLCVTAAHAAPRAGILPVSGEPLLAARLDREIGQSLADRGVRDILEPTELAAQLGSLPGIPAALEAARALLDRAGKAALYMKRGDSVDLARQAIGKLEEALARHHARPLLARAHGALARALLLKPADEAGAREAFRAAAAVVPDFRGESLPPRATQLLEAARREARATAPSAEELQRAAARARLDAVVWIAVHAAEGSQVDVELLSYHVSEGAVRAHRKRGATAEVTRLAADLAVRVLRPPAAAGPAARSLPVPAAPPATRPDLSEPPTPLPPPRPWYGQWWVWTIAGVAVTGAALGLGLGLGLRSRSAPPSGLDFEFIY